jgi:hypothetical protein
MITVKEVLTKKELKSFVKFPFTLYKNSKSWVPPIISEEINALDKDVNPVFKDAEARYFLAYKDNEIVGRIAAIINWLEVNNQGIKKMRFGWFDVIDDIEVTKALLNEVHAIGKSKGLDHVEGPVGFSNLDKVGVVYEGFDHIASMITWHNYAYYPEHFRTLGYTVGKGYSENKMKFENIKPEFFRRIQELIKKRYELREVNFTSNKEIMPYTDEMFEVFSKSHAVLSSFVEITPEQRNYFKKKFIGFVNPEYVKFVVDKNDKLVAFGIVTPSYAEALQKMNGKLFPFGIFHLLKAKKHSKTVTFYLIGVLPEYQNKGVTAIIFNEFHKTFEEKGIKMCIRGPELDDNEAIHKLWKNFKPEVFKRRCTFKTDIV